MPSIPTLPRLPGLPDPLRRIDAPDDLASVTTTGDEQDPAAAGMSDGGVERIWRSAVDLYRSGVHPAVQVCIRRNGAVVLDRAIGHARGNGPHDSAEDNRVLATPGTPFLIFSGSKALTAFVIHLLHERGVLDINQRVCEYIPGYAERWQG